MIRDALLDIGWDDAHPANPGYAVFATRAAAIAFQSSARSDR